MLITLLMTIMPLAGCFGSDEVMSNDETTGGFFDF